MSSTTLMEVGRSLVYNPYYVADVRLLEGYNEATRIVRAIIRQFVNIKKICGSRNLTQHIIRSGLGKQLTITDDDIDTAYAIGAGGGCEYEWAYE